MGFAIGLTSSVKILNNVALLQIELQNWKLLALNGNLFKVSKFKPL